MQAEYPPLRLGGFIISPEYTNEILLPKPVSTSSKKKRKKKKEALLSFSCEFKSFSHNFSRFLFLRLISVVIAMCCVCVFFKYFSIGTAVYHDNIKIGIAESEKDFYNALAAASATAEENLVNNFTINYTLTPTVTLRKSILSTRKLQYELLLCSPKFKRACALCADGKALFYAENEECARSVLKSYIEKYSVNGKSSLNSNISYKSCVVSCEKISDKDACSKLLAENESIAVVSVVNTSIEKEIPFETTIIKDSDMYIGESYTVTEGKTGTAALVRENVYQNGTCSSSRILSENIITLPVTRVVREGTKKKDVLKTGLSYPLSGVISSPFGARWGRMHEGLDIAVAEGTAVFASECGVVSYVNENAGGYGKLIRIDHGFGIETAYAHLSKIDVCVGQSVNTKTRIALSGNTGKSTGPHLHFEVRQNNTPLNPEDYLKKRM